MGKYIYIQKDTRGVHDPDTLMPDVFPQGCTCEDYLDGKWILLSEEQVAFRDLHPGASAMEIIGMETVEMLPPDPTFEEKTAMELDGIANAAQRTLERLEGLADVMRIVLNDISPSLSDGAVRELPVSLFDGYDADGDYGDGRVVVRDGAATRVFRHGGVTELQDVATGAALQMPLNLDGQMPLDGVDGIKG